MLRATFAGFSTAYSSLQENQKRLDIVGQNLANMNTPGYTRQALKTSSINYTHTVSHYSNGTETVVGFGVRMEKVVQLRDPYLDGQYRDQIQKSGYTEGIDTALNRLANFLDESQIEGIRKAFDNIQSTLTNMQDLGKINDPVFESELRSRMQALTNMLNDADRQINKAEKDEFSRLDGTGTNENGAVQEINDILKQISSLNRQIKDNQIFGQQSLELMDQRNLLLDELASYIPIEVSYYKDMAHDGFDANGNPALGELYYVDDNGTPYAKKEWPDDLRVEMVYQDENGDTQRLLLVEGTAGSGTDNIGQVDITGGSVNDPTGIALTFKSVAEDYKGNAMNDTLVFGKDNNGAITNQFPPSSGSVQASLDMLWKDGETTGISDVRGYEFYRNQLDNLAKTFATVVNNINIKGSSKNAGGNWDETQFLLADKTGNPPNWNNITAANIGINSNWSSGVVHLGNAGDSSNNTVLNLIQSMQNSFPLNANISFKDSDGNPIIFESSGNIGSGTAETLDLKNNSFADFMNHTATIMANDTFSNQQSFKTNVTVLNGIQNSRDAVSGVSLDEEAANMMVYMSAYSASSRLMTTLDEALNILINNTGLVGR